MIKSGFPNLIKIIIFLILLFIISISSFYVYRFISTRDRSFIFLVAPDVDDYYYKEVFNDIVDFQVNFIKSAGSNDKAFIIASDKTAIYYEDAISKDNLLLSNIHDIWIRDFAPVETYAGYYKFIYQPSYLDKRVAKWIQDSFMKWFYSMGFHAQNVDLVLDGGNFVYNGYGKVVITERIFHDNPSMTPNEIISLLLNLNGIDSVAIIPEEKGDVTGHADGMVFWITPNIIAVNKYDEPFRSKVISALKKAFPDVKIIELPYSPSNEIWRGFPSACGIYVNALATNRYIYVPVYGLPSDSEALTIFQKYSNKKIIPINSSKVCKLGGSLHCLTWEIHYKENLSSLKLIINYLGINKNQSLYNRSILPDEKISKLYQYNKKISKLYYLHQII